MIKEELYNRTVDVLKEAYFNDTLVSESCTACACGNLIMAANGYKEVEMGGDVFWMDKQGNYRNPEWINVVGTTSVHIGFIRLSKKQHLYIDRYEGEVKEEIKSTGYDLHEFAAIESAFEKGYKGFDKMFNALMSVVDTLDKIHQNTNTQVTIQSKSKFQKVNN